MKKNRSIDLKYVVVEITLVTIGILIAIGVNNWNSSRLIQIEIDDYLLEIHSEIQSGIKYQEQYINRFESMSSSLIRVMKIIERNDIKIYGDFKNQTSIISFNIDGIHFNDLAMLLDKKNIAIRTGHHCAQPILNKFKIKSLSRISLYFYNTKEEIDYFYSKLKKVIKILS